jgi:predicted nucleic acid-binding protein
VIVVDTTVWIDFLEARGTPFDRHLTELLEGDALIGLIDIVYCEVLQGIRDEDVFHRTRRSLLAHSRLRRTFIGRRVAGGLPSDEASTA